VVGKLLQISGGLGAGDEWIYGHRLHNLTRVGDTVLPLLLLLGEMNGGSPTGDIVVDIRGGGGGVISEDRVDP
jgi:hypothetical protein